MSSRHGLRERETRTLAALAACLLPEGCGLPGADELGLAERMQQRSRTWDAAQVKQIGALVRSWELAPLASKNLKTFSKLTPEQRGAWVEACYRSRVAWRRLLTAALKQLIFIEWASSAPVEDELGYDYRCRRDDEVHGAARPDRGGAAADPAAAGAARLPAPGPGLRTEDDPHEGSAATRRRHGDSRKPAPHDPRVAGRRGRGDRDR